MFKDEYKQANKSISPSPDLLNSISAAMHKEAEALNENNINSFRKSDRKFSMIGRITGIAAAVCIIIAAAVFIPIMMNSGFSLADKNEVQSPIGGNGTGDSNQLPSPDGTSTAAGTYATECYGTTGAEYTTNSAAETYISSTGSKNDDIPVSSKPEGDSPYPSDELMVLGCYLNANGVDTVETSEVNVEYYSRDFDVEILANSFRTRDAVFMNNAISMLSESPLNNSNAKDEEESESVTVTFKNKNGKDYMSLVFRKCPTFCTVSVCITDTAKTAEFTIDSGQYDRIAEYAKQQY